MKTLESRRLRPEADEKQLIDLFDKVFGYTVSPEMWEWKYRPPWTSRHYCWVGECDDKLVGFFGAVPMRGMIEGEEVPFFQLADVMVHPEYRRKFDYFTLGHEAVLKDIVDNHPRHLVYGFSEHRAFRWFERFGWSALIEQALVRSYSPQDTAPSERFALREWDWNQPELTTLWEARRGDVGAGLIRDADYVGWRYGRHPVFPYRLFGVYDGDTARGWMVAGMGKKRKKTGELDPTAVVDLLVDEESAGDVLQALANHLDHPVKLWLPRRIELPGAAEKETRTHVWHSVASPAASHEFLCDHLYYTMGDVDWW